jgi:D-galactarolactone cycloisomerase
MSVLALQSGEQGPFAQAIAGVDIALWDLFARRAKTPLWRMLGGSSGRMRAYASGINPDGCVAAAEAAMRRGHRAFKLKIGFGAERDRGNLRELRWLIGDHVLAVDVNQGWSIAEAREQAPPLEQFGLAWLEEHVAPRTGRRANGAACQSKSRFCSPVGRTSPAPRPLQPCLPKAC